LMIRACHPSIVGHDLVSVFVFFLNFLRQFVRA
jgi:hypothetical protein